MNISTSVIDQIRSSLHAALLIEASLAVFADNKIMGINEKGDAAIISEVSGLPDALKMGVGRVDELMKRLSILAANAEGELKLNDKGETVLLTLTAGRSKIQFRCSSLSMLEKKYPKENADTPSVVVTLSKEEADFLLRGVRAFSAETVLVKVAPSGEVLLECVDSNNDKLQQVAAAKAERVSDATGAVLFSYRADILAKILAEATKDAPDTAIIIGEEGTATLLARGHTLIIMPRSTGE
jgi:hypothetical protein